MRADEPHDLDRERDECDQIDEAEQAQEQLSGSDERHGDSLLSAR
jgi:hypothetical protein